jgi:hypothetical protein
MNANGVNKESGLAHIIGRFSTGDSNTLSKL